MRFNRCSRFDLCKIQYFLTQSSGGHRKGPRTGCLFLILFVALMMNEAFADSLSLSAQRLAFKAADEALQQGKPVALEAFKNYPLYPYLLYRDLQQRLEDNPVQQIRSFLKFYGNTPVGRRLRAAWLRQLAKEQRWNDFLHDYQISQDVALNCWHRQALLNTGQQKTALQGIEKVWMSPASRPRACDPLFNIWKEHGGITRERIWKRFSLALAKGEQRLARYLQGLLPRQDQEIAELWLAVHSNPRLVLEANRFNPSNSHTGDILIHGLWRWSRMDSVSAAKALDTIKQRYRLPEDQLALLERQIALFVASRADPNALDRLTDLPDSMVDTQVREWRVRTGLQRGDWNMTLTWLNRLTLTEQKDLQWQYWRARALEAVGQRRNARQIYRHLAKQRDYYGFLAADRLDVSYPMKDVPIRVSEEELNALEQIAGIQRARELQWLGRWWEARSEWQYAIAQLNQQDLKKAAKLAQRWGWHYQAIVTLARAGYWDDLELRFPLPFRDTVLTNARRKDIDPAWVYAVMRQESLFRTDIRSSAGALGLMQIMPSTGQHIATDLQLSLPSYYALLQADTNILYGTHYLRHTLDKLQDNSLLATAAYNAGPQKVAAWLPAKEAMEADRWVETLPYLETRRYVKRVMEYATIYQYRLGLTGSSMGSRMVKILPDFSS